MKKIYKLLLSVAIILASAWQATAQTMPVTDGSIYYYIQFKRGTNLVVKDMGADAIMQSATLSLGDNSQLFKVEAGTTAGTYILTSKLGNKINWNGSRFATSATTSVNIRFISSPNTTYKPAWELQREASTSMCMNPFGGSNPGSQLGEWNTGDAGNPLAFVSTKDILKARIDAATTVYNNTSIGADPGKFNETDRTTFQSAITTAQGVYDSTTATEADIVTAMNNLTTAQNTYLSTVIVPKLSDGTNTYWYYIQGTRPTNTYMTTRGTGGKIADLAVIPDDTQLWKLVANAGGFALVNKSTGEYINSNVTSGTEFVTQATAPTNGLRAIASTTYTNQTARFWIENLSGATPAVRFHAGGTGNGSNVMNYTGDPNDNCTWLFMDYTVALKQFLLTSINDAQAVYNNTTEGTAPGQFTATARTDLANAIATAQAVYDDPSSTNYVAAKDALNAALATYMASVVKPTVSTTGNDVWYAIYTTRLTNGTMTSNGAGAKVNSQLYTASDSQLWKVVANGTGYALVNKATVEYLNADATGDAATNTKVDMPTNALSFNPSIENIAETFMIEGTNFRLHTRTSGYSYDIINFGAGVTDNTSYKFVPYVAPSLSNSYMTVGGTTGAWYNGSGTGHATSFQDANLGTFDKTTVSSFKFGGEVTVTPSMSGNATLYYSIDGSTTFKAIQLPVSTGDKHYGETDISITGLTVGEHTISVYFQAGESYDSNNSANYTAKFTVSDPTAPTWIGNSFVTIGGSTGTWYNASGTGNPTTFNGAVLGDFSATIDLGGELQVYPKVNTPALAPANSAAGGKTNVIQASTDPLMYYSIDNGTPVSLALPKVGEEGNNSKHYATTTVDISGLSAGTHNLAVWFKAREDVNLYDSNNSANYVATFSKISTGVNSANADKYQITVSNGIIAVAGAENFEVYSISGQRVNAKQALQNGIYVVKVKDHTQKVVVK